MLRSYEAIVALGNELRGVLEQQTQAINEVTKATRENKQTPFPALLHIRAETETIEAEQIEERRENRRNRRIQIWLAVATSLAFLSISPHARYTTFSVKRIRRRFQKRTAKPQATRAGRISEIENATGSCRLFLLHRWNRCRSYVCC